MISQSCAIRSQSRKNVKFVKIMAQTFLNSESSCDLTDAPASMYDRKTAAGPFDTIHDILQFGAISSQRPKCANLAHREPSNLRVKYFEPILIISIIENT